VRWRKAFHPTESLGEGRKARLGEPCPKVRLSQDRMPVGPLTQQQSCLRGKRASLPSPS